jgi:hypothetical protein
MNYWTDRVVHLLRACVRDREKLSAERSIDVLFHEFMADDLAMVKKIYAKAGLNMTTLARDQLQAFVDEHPRGKDGRVIYNLRGDFGVEPAQLRAHFDFYVARFPVKVEVL